MDDEIKKWLFDIKISIACIYEYLGEKRTKNEKQKKKNGNPGKLYGFGCHIPDLHRLLGINSSCSERTFNVC